MKINKILTNFAMLLTCILMLVAIAVTKNKRLLGHDLVAVKSEIPRDSVQTLSIENGTMVINTSSIGKDITGYGGPVPLKIYLDGGHITRIEVQRNAETPEFIGRVEKELLSQYVGRTVEEATVLQVDAVSGATMSSGAVIKNMQRGLAETSVESVSQAQDVGFGLKQVVALLIALCAATIPLFYKNKVYRLMQLALNVLVLGIYTGTFVSYTSMVSILSNGFTWGQATLGVLLVVAFLYPLFGRKGHYCAWCCPLGSVQELMGKTRKRKLSIPPVWLHRLSWFRQGLWCVLMLLAWTGILTDWMDYELFSAFIWQSASWVLLVFGVVVLLFSVFVARPYCRFICPTGTVLKSL